MHKSLEQIINSIAGLKMEKGAKNRIRGNLSHFMSEHPVSNAYDLRHLEQRSAFRIIFSLIKKPMSIILIMTMLFGGSLSYASESSLPGDYLYPVKVGINETVKGSLQFSSEAKARWDTRLAERRLEEAEKLALSGGAWGEQRLSIEDNFARHAAKVENRIKKFETEENLNAAAEVASNFETSLNAHEKILLRISEDGESSKTEIAELIKKLKVKNDSMSQTRLEIEAKISLKSSEVIRQSAGEKRDSAKQKLVEVRNFISKSGADFEAEAKAEAEARLQTAGQVIVEGEAKLSAGAYGDAFALFQKAHRIAQEAKLILSARRTLKLNVRFNGKTETESQKNRDGAGSSSDDSEPESSANNSVSGKSEIEVEDGSSNRIQVEGQSEIDKGGDDDSVHGDGELKLDLEL